jgi:hypothetical protein
MARRRIDASHVIAFQDGGHRYLKDGVVVTDGSTSSTSAPPAPTTDRPTKRSTAAGCC